MLIDFNSISDVYPLKMKLSIGGEAQKYQATNGGTYFLQEDKTNNNRYWIHQSGYIAIWWSPTDKWIVGDFDFLGSSRAGILGPSNNDSPPNQTTNGWQYWNGTNWHTANDVHFEDWTFKQGKFLHLLYKNSFQSVYAEFKQMSHFYDFIISHKESIFLHFN